MPRTQPLLSSCLCIRCAFSAMHKVMLAGYNATRIRHGCYWLYELFLHQIAPAIGTFWCLKECVLVIVFWGTAVRAVSSNTPLKELCEGNYKQHNFLRLFSYVHDSLEKEAPLVLTIKLPERIFQYKCIQQPLYTS